MDDTDSETPSKSRFIRFNPTINSGHILTAFSVIIASALAWAQLRSDVNVLVESDKARKQEIASIETQREADRSDILQKLTSSQSALHEEMKEMRGDIVQHLNRLDDKLDRKEDKRNVR